jgi:hypothetical protein
MCAKTRSYTAWDPSVTVFTTGSRTKRSSRSGEIVGLPPEECLVARKPVTPRVAELEGLMSIKRPRRSRHAETTRERTILLTPRLTIRSLDDDRICWSNNAAERALRGIAIGRFGPGD